MGNGSIEIITGRERRRRWSIEDKLRIVAESNEPGARVTEVAARHEIYPGLLFSWRRQAREGALAPPPPVTFVPVRIASEGGRPEAAPAAAALAPPSGPVVVEITLSNGCQLRIDQHVDPRALRQIVAALRR